VARLQTASTPPSQDGPATDVLGRVVDEVLPLADELSFLDAGPAVWDLPQLQDAGISVSSALDAHVERGQREGDIRGDVPAEVVVEAFTGILLGVWNGVRDGRWPRHPSRHRHPRARRRHRPKGRGRAMTSTAVRGPRAATVLRPPASRWWPSVARPQTTGDAGRRVVAAVTVPPAAVDAVAARSTCSAGARRRWAATCCRW
jgi:hypothetical protein